MQATGTRLIRFYGPHVKVAGQVVRWMAGMSGGRYETPRGSIVAPGEEDQYGCDFRVPEGSVAVWDMGWWVVKDDQAEYLPIIVRSILGGSLLGDWTERY